MQGVFLKRGSGLNMTCRGLHGAAQPLQGAGFKIAPCARRGLRGAAKPLQDRHRVPMVRVSRSSRRRAAVAGTTPTPPSVASCCGSRSSWRRAAVAGGRLDGLSFRCVLFLFASGGHARLALSSHAPRSGAAVLGIFDASGGPIGGGTKPLAVQSEKVLAGIVVLVVAAATAVPGDHVFSSVIRIDFSAVCLVAVACREGRAEFYDGSRAPAWQRITQPVKGALQSISE